MRNYQILALVGGIFGIVIVPIILFSFAALMSIASVFSGDPSELDPETLGEITAVSIIISVIVSVIAIVIVFTSKETKKIAYVLFALAIVSLIATNISGVVTWILFFVGGFTALKWKGKSERLEKSALDVLKERYAKGEISKEEFDIKKKDLE